MTGVILALDQGTTSSRAMAIGLDGQVIASAQEEFPQIFPQSGWVEHDPEAIWRTQRRTAEQTVERLGDRKIAAIGVTNQRETVVVWDRKTGEAIHNAIVWQDRRTASRTQALAAQGHEAMVNERTGLVLDPYFSASKISWILDAVPGARARSARRTRRGHDRVLPDLAAHRRPGPRDGRHQRFAHCTLRHTHRPLGRRPLQAFQRARQHAA